MTANRSWLYGFLALQNDFVSRTQLTAAFSLWLQDKSKSLQDLLRNHAKIPESEHKLLEGLIEVHLSRNENDAEKSLAALSSIGSMRDELRAFGDPEIDATLPAISREPAESSSAARPERPEPGDETVSARGQKMTAGRFRILRPHARGGLGEVSVARDTELNREVALKEIQTRFADDSDSRQRFLREAEVTGGLEHPGIVPVYGLGQYGDGRPFYAMRFVRGDNLKEAIAQFHRPHKKKQDDRERLLQLRDLLGRFVDVCNALEYAHSRGVLHRDLKPGNIMLGRYGETLVVDWGLAKTMGSSDFGEFEEPTLQPESGGSSTPTQMGSAIGTPNYMSPEQAAGQLDQLGPASDVYGLGATLYCLLTSKAPFADCEKSDVLNAVQQGVLTHPSELAEVPPALEAICLKAMSRNSESRYESPRLLAAEVERWLADEPVQAYAEPIASRAWRQVRRRKTAVASSAAAVLVSLVGLALLTAVVSNSNQQLSSANQIIRKQVDDIQRTNDKLAESNEELKTARAKADDSRQRAEKVMDYLVNALRSPDPEHEGRTITIAEVLDQSMKTMRDDLRDEPLTRAQLAEAIGRSYSGLGLLQPAVAALEMSRDIRQQELGDHPETFSSMNSLGDAYLAASHLNKSQQLFQDAFARGSEFLGADHAETLRSLDGLASTYQETGDLEKAIQLHKKAIELRERNFGADHIDTLGSRNNLASAYFRMGKTKEAIRIWENVLEVRERTFGKRHPDTMTSMSNYSLVLQAVSRFDESMKLQQETLALRKDILGPNHPDTLLSTANLASLMYTMGRVDEALELFEKVVEITEAIEGPNHVDTMLAINNLAIVYYAAKLPEKAMSMMAEAVRRRKLVLGDDHPQTLNSVNALASLYQEANQLEKAIPMFVDTLRLRKAKLGPTAPVTLSSMDNLATAYLRDEQFDESERVMRDCLKLRLENYPDHWQTANTRRMLGALLVEQKEFAEAEELLLASYQELLSRADKIPPIEREKKIRSPMEALVELYLVWGKPQQATEWTEKLKARAVDPSPTPTPK